MLNCGVSRELLRRKAVIWTHADARRDRQTDLEENPVALKFKTLRGYGAFPAFRPIRVAQHGHWRLDGVCRNFHLRRFTVGSPYMSNRAS